MDLGTDIAGWIEVRDGRPSVWSGVVHLTPLLDRDYDTFGSLFGVNNFAGFALIAGGRGLPDDCSAEVRAEIAEWDPHGRDVGERS